MGYREPKNHVKPCTVDGCTRPRSTGSLCLEHYKRRLRQGFTNAHREVHGLTTYLHQGLLDWSLDAKDDLLTQQQQQQQQQHIEEAKTKRQKALDAFGAAATKEELLDLLDEVMGSF